MEYTVLRHKYRWFQNLYVNWHKTQTIKKIVESSSELQIFFNWASKLPESTYAIFY